MDLLKVKLAEYLSNYQISVTFSNGAKLICDLSQTINQGVFRTLMDQEQFKRFSVKNGVIEWTGEIDIAPEYLYKIGTPLPGTEKLPDPDYVTWSA